jgi:hypothetical protein
MRTSPTYFSVSLSAILTKTHIHRLNKMAQKLEKAAVNLATSTTNNGTYNKCYKYVCRYVMHHALWHVNVNVLLSEGKIVCDSKR